MFHGKIKWPFHDKKIPLPYLPVYAPYFFEGKNVQNLGCGLYPGTRLLELFNMQNFPTHAAESTIESY